MESISRFDLQDRLRGLASDRVAQAGLELVDLTLLGGGGHRVLRITIDRPGATGVDLGDCERMSRALGLALEESDLVPSSYVLEVSSPGADRPIRSRDDIRRNTGRRVAVTAVDPVDGERSYSGRLVGCEASCMVLSGDDEKEIRIPLDGIVRAQQELEL